MHVDPKGPVRLIMPNGAFTIQGVQRIVIGKILEPKADFPRFYFRAITIETEEGKVEVLMESTNERALRMEAEGGLLADLKKQVMG